MKPGGIIWDEGYIAVDWGTTNRRAYAIDADGRCIGSLEDDEGVLSVETDGFPSRVEHIRSRLGDRPMLLAGMVGSDRGWRPAPYVACPAGLADVAAAIVWMESGRLGIVPGVSQQVPHADVMRGEEVQALGAVDAGLVPPDAIICHPGTHAKWIGMTDGRIAGFHTTMTGEIFALLSKHSILASQLDDPVEPDASFRLSVDQGLTGGDPLSALFAIRARHVLGDAGPQGASHASGLLIGADVRSALVSAPDGPVHVVGRPELCAYYRIALEQAGRSVIEIDGAIAFRAGIAALVERIA